MYYSVLFVHNIFLSYKSSLEPSVEAQCKYIVLTGHICLDLLYIIVNIGKFMSVFGLLTVNTSTKWTGIMITQLYSV